MHFANVFRISSKPRRSQYNTSFTWKSTCDLFDRFTTLISSGDAFFFVDIYVCIIYNVKSVHRYHIKRRFCISHIVRIIINVALTHTLMITLKEYSAFEFNCTLYFKQSYLWSKKKWIEQNFCIYLSKKRKRVSRNSYMKLDFSQFHCISLPISLRILARYNRVKYLDIAFLKNAIHVTSTMWWMHRNFMDWSQNGCSLKRIHKTLYVVI